MLNIPLTNNVQYMSKKNDANSWNVFPKCVLHHSCAANQKASSKNQKASFEERWVCMYTRSKKFTLKSKKDLGMACHTPPLKRVKKQGEMLNGMGPRLGNGISPCFFTFFEGWSMTGHP